VNLALMEAWNWLENEGFLIRDAGQPQSLIFFLSRRAQRLRSVEDFAAYRKANQLPKGQLHPLVATKVYPAFLRGEYDTAVFQAFREVEIAVRGAGCFEADDVGTDLMRDAFRPLDPKKTRCHCGTSDWIPSSPQLSSLRLPIFSLARSASIRFLRATATCQLTLPTRLKS
jgi:Protein of unknown function (Hypoth_ymh)